MMKFDDQVAEVDKVAKSRLSVSLESREQMKTIKSAAATTTTSQITMSTAKRKKKNMIVTGTSNFLLNSNNKMSRAFRWHPILFYCCAAILLVILILQSTTNTGTIHCLGEKFDSPELAHLRLVETKTSTIDTSQSSGK